MEDADTYTAIGHTLQGAKHLKYKRGQTKSIHRISRWLGSGSPLLRIESHCDLVAIFFDASHLGVYVYK